MARVVRRRREAATMSNETKSELLQRPHIESKTINVVCFTICIFHAVCEVHRNISEDNVEVTVRIISVTTVKT